MNFYPLGLSFVKIDIEIASGCLGTIWEQMAKAKIADNLTIKVICDFRTRNRYTTYEISSK